MTQTTVVSDFHSIKPPLLREPLGSRVELVVESLGSPDRLVAACKEHEADAVITDINTPVPETAIDSLEVDIIARAAVGFDNIDIEAAHTAGITVTNAPGYCTEDVAIHTASLLLSGIRAIPQLDHDIKAGAWGSEALYPPQPLHRTSEKTLGFISFGEIAQRTAECTAGFGFSQIAYDPYLNSETIDNLAVDVELVNLDTVLLEADYISVNAPETPETHHLLNSDRFSQMQDHVLVVNTGRGGVVDETALLNALDENEIGAAALDVFESEPLDAGSPLAQHPDVITTPHIAWYSEESIQELNETVAQNVSRVLAGKTPISPVEPEWA